MKVQGLNVPVKAILIGMALAISSGSAFAQKARIEKSVEAKAAHLVELAKSQEAKPVISALFDLSKPGLFLRNLTHGENVGFKNDALVIKGAAGKPSQKLSIDLNNDRLADALISLSEMPAAKQKDAFSKLAGSLDVYSKKGTASITDRQRLDIALDLIVIANATESVNYSPRQGARMKSGLIAGEPAFDEAANNHVIEIKSIAAAFSMTPGIKGAKSASEIYKRAVNEYGKDLAPDMKKRMFECMGGSSPS